MTAATVKSIRRETGVAGRIAYHAAVTYPGVRAPSRYTFVGSVYGGPIVVITPRDTQVFVTDPCRFGPTLSPEWVRRFFQPQEAS